eukprot:363408-Chlamydomonas_euryale.AAC.8
MDACDTSVQIKYKTAIRHRRPQPHDGLAAPLPTTAWVATSMTRMPTWTTVRPQDAVAPAGPQHVPSNL